MTESKKSVPSKTKEERLADLQEQIGKLMEEREALKAEPVPEQK